MGYYEKSKAKVMKDYRLKTANERKAKKNAQKSSKPLEIDAAQPLAKARALQRLLLKIWTLLKVKTLRCRLHRQNMMKHKSRSSRPVILPAKSLPKISKRKQQMS